LVYQGNTSFINSLLAKINGQQPLQASICLFTGATSFFTPQILHTPGKNSLGKSASKRSADGALGLILPPQPAKRFLLLQTWGLKEPHSAPKTQTEFSIFFSFQKELKKNTPQWGFF
jgi:hypothetical protein